MSPTAKRKFAQHPITPHESSENFTISNRDRQQQLNDQKNPELILFSTTTDENLINILPIDAREVLSKNNVNKDNVNDFIIQFADFKAISSDDLLPMSQEVINEIDEQLKNNSSIALEARSIREFYSINPNYFFTIKEKKIPIIIKVIRDIMKWPKGSKTREIKESLKKVKNLSQEIINFLSDLFSPETLYQDVETNNNKFRLLIRSHHINLEYFTTKVKEEFKNENIENDLKEIKSRINYVVNMVHNFMYLKAVFEKKTQPYFYIALIFDKDSNTYHIQFLCQKDYYHHLLGKIVLCNSRKIKVKPLVNIESSEIKVATIEKSAEELFKFLALKIANYETPTLLNIENGKYSIKYPRGSSTETLSIKNLVPVSISLKDELPDNLGNLTSKNSSGNNLIKKEHLNFNNKRDSVSNKIFYYVFSKKANSNKAIKINHENKQLQLDSTATKPSISIVTPRTENKLTQEEKELLKSEINKNSSESLLNFVRNNPNKKSAFERLVALVRQLIPSFGGRSENVNNEANISAARSETSLSLIQEDGLNMLLRPTVSDSNMSQYFENNKINIEKEEGDDSKSDLKLTKSKSTSYEQTPPATPPRNKSQKHNAPPSPPFRTVPFDSSQVSEKKKTFSEIKNMPKALKRKSSEAQENH